MSRERQNDFEASYAGTAPWDAGHPQPAFGRLVADGRLHGRVLDAGCGTGEHALMAAQAGCESTGIDFAPSAIRLAIAKAETRGIDARFLVWDALDLASLGEQFDAVLDCGLFHTFDDEDRAPLVASLASALRPGGTYYMLCFSEDEPGDWGPRRVTQQEIRDVFADGWRVEAIEPAELDITIRDEPARAWFATIRRA